MSFQIPSVIVDDFDDDILKQQSSLDQRTIDNEDINNNSGDRNVVAVFDQEIAATSWSDDRTTSPTKSPSSCDLDAGADERRRDADDGATVQLTRRWGTIDLSGEQQRPTTSSIAGGRKRPATTAALGGSSVPLMDAAAGAPFKSILKHSRSADAQRGTGASSKSPAGVPRKAISFSQDVIFRG
jgi:hypothetical protein